MLCTRAGLLVVLASLACRREGPSTHGSTLADTHPTGLPGRPTAAMPAMPFPLHPARCDYTLPAVSPGLPQVNAHAPVYGPAPRVRNLHITFVGDPAQSAVIQWSTDSATLASEVAFGVAGRALDQVARGYSFTYTGPGAAGRREHEVHLCGLTPGTRYTYRAGGDPGQSGQYSFVTAPVGPTEVRAIVVGDARTDPRTWSVVAAHAAAEHADVLLFTGDAVADGANQTLWDEFFDAAPEFFATHPALWADGNHEGISEVYYAQMALPDNGSPRRHEHWYAVAYGPMTVIALNDTTVPTEEITGEETTWLRATLAGINRQRTPYVFTMHHQPMYTTSVGHIPDLLTRRAWEPLFDAYHVNADLAGHVHNYESTLPLHGGQVVAATQGTRYLIYGGGGAPLYPFRADESWVQHHESVHGFAVLTAGPGVLTWDARRADGSRIETLDLLQ